ncbi:MAG: ABC transporter ATP-binding protein [Pantoea sp.]|uniref:ATP-binding cassette domain-containing protein n=1 Tax=Pantoea sp. TaxID=69393 RepID=UPI0039E334FF
MNILKSLLLPIQWNVIQDTISRCRLPCALFLCAAVVSSVCTVSGPLIFSYAIAQFNHAPVFSLFSYLLMFSLTVAAIRGLQDVKLILCNRIEQEVRYATGKRIFTDIINAKPDLFVSYNPGKISALLQGLHQSNKIYVQLFLMVIVGGFVDILLSFILIGKYIDWSVALFVIVYGAIVVVLTLHSNKVTAKHQQHAQDKFNESANLLGNIVSNIVSIKVFLGQGWVTSLYDKYNDSSKKSWVTFYNVRLGYGLAQSLLLFLQYSLIFFMILWVNGNGGTINQLVMVSMVLIQLNRPFELIGSSLRDFIIAKGMADPVQTMLSRYCGNTDDVLPASPDFDEDIYNDLVLELKNLSFRYISDEKNCLNNISAIFRRGRINFIMGPSGIGKSTLMLTILGMQQGYTGSVLISGRELKSIDVNSHLKHTGYVPQDAMMMNLSIRENILVGRNFRDEEVMKVLDLVCLTDKISGLPEGLDFFIGERGALLSGGERQRLAIARALIGKPKLLLLDEVTSALDEPTELNIFSLLRKISSETTIVAITHRKSIIQDDDFVLNLKSGRNSELNFYSCAESS